MVPVESFVPGYLPRTHFVFRFQQGDLGRFIESLEHVDINRAALAATDIVEDAVDRLLRVVAGDRRLCVCEELGVCLERVCGSVKTKVEQLRGLFESFESPVIPSLSLFMRV
jgi:hypothetical protein